MICILKLIPNTISILLGISIPGLVLGRTVFAVFLALAVLLILFDKPFSEIRENFKGTWAKPLGMLLLLVFILCLPSLFASEFPGRSFSALFRTFVFCSLGILIWVYYTNRPEFVDVWMKSLIVSSVVSIAFAFYSQYVSSELYWLLHLKGWKSDALNHNLKGFTAVAVLIIPLLFLGFSRLTHAYKLLVVIGTMSLIYLLWDISNRATIAGLLGMVLCTAVAVCVRFGSKIQVLFTGGAALVSFAGVMTWLRITRDRMILAAPEGDYFLPVWLIDFERQTIWLNAIEIGLRTPWFGRGPNTINFAPGADKLLEGSGGLHVIPAHPHNWVVELFAEIGTIGLACLVVFLVVATVTLLKNYRTSGNPLYISAIAIFAGYWCSGLFNFSYWSAWWQLAFILALALSLTASQKSAIPDQKLNDGNVAYR